MKHLRRAFSSKKRKKIGKIASFSKVQNTNKQQQTIAIICILLSAKNNSNNKITTATAGTATATPAMTSLLPLDTSSTSVQGEDESQQQQQQEQCTTTIADETPGNGTESNNISPTTTPFASTPAPTRIPHPNVPLRRSATMRLRSTKQQQQMQAELGSLPTGEFSTRAKLTPSSSPTPTPCPRKLTRNRTWCPLGHSAEQQQQQRKDTQQAQGDAARVQQQHQQHIREACSDIQFELHTSLDNMAASSAASKSSRNMVSLAYIL